MLNTKILSLLNQGFNINMCGEKLVISREFSQYYINESPELELLSMADETYIYGAIIGKVKKTYAKIYTQCQTENGEIGTFIAENKGKPLSPLFDSHYQLKNWMKLNDWQIVYFDGKEHHPHGIALKYSVI